MMTLDFRTHAQLLFALALVAGHLVACGNAEETPGDAGMPPDAEATFCVAGATEACYSGAQSTTGVGLCKSGLHTCAEDGSSWSACEGEVLPASEVCASTFDEDCDGMVDEDLDIDGDGFTFCGGDCCETVEECAEPAKVNPGAIEVASEPDEQSVDENCNGVVDEVQPACDGALALANTDPASATQAIELCAAAVSGAPGVVDAKYVRANGLPASPTFQVGLQAAFGPNVAPRAGNSMLALSTGHSRSIGQPGECGTATCSVTGAGTPPPGFPQDVPNCPGGTTINDDIALEVTLQAPTNASGYSFDFKFYSFEYPESVCTTFNDQFVAIVSPPPQGAINGNIAFDSMANPVSVNIALFDVCQGCPLGTSELQGTGFDVWNDAGATDWLRTTAPVEPGSTVTIRFAIWDTGDNASDSTVLIDNFQWLAESVSVGTGPAGS